MIEWVVANKEWVFSGIGGTIATAIIALIKRRKADENKTHGIEQTQKSGMFSKNTQVGSVNINSKNGENK